MPKRMMSTPEVREESPAPQQAPQPVSMKKVVKGIFVVLSAMALVATIAIGVVVVAQFRAIDQGATGTNSGSPPPATSTTATTSLSTTAAAPVTTTLVTRTEVLETNPCKLVSRSEIFAAFKSQQTPMILMSPEGAPAIGTLQERLCSYQSLYTNVSIATLVDPNGQYLPQVKASMQSDRYFRDVSNPDFARKAEGLGSDAFRTLTTLHFKVKTVVVAITITSRNDPLVDHETPLLAIGKLIAPRVYTLE